jgi:hypothetical protein
MLVRMVKGGLLSDPALQPGSAWLAAGYPGASPVTMAHKDVSRAKTVLGRLERSADQVAQTAGATQEWGIANEPLSHALLLAPR